MLLNNSSPIEDREDETHPMAQNRGFRTVSEYDRGAELDNLLNYIAALTALIHPSTLCSDKGGPIRRSRRQV